MTLAKPTVTIERLYELLTYDPETGIFLWRKSQANKLPGKRAGYEDNKRGYRYINIDGQRYYEHRLAWFYVKREWPEYEIDHKHGRTNDNRFSELRAATSKQNKANRIVRRNSACGLKGVSYDRRRGTWCMDIGGLGNRCRKSGFATADEAHAAYREKAREFYGEFARFE